MTFGSFVMPSSNLEKDAINDDDDDERWARASNLVYFDAKPTAIGALSGVTGWRKKPKR